MQRYDMNTTREKKGRGMERCTRRPTLPPSGPGGHAPPWADPAFRIGWLPPMLLLLLWACVLLASVGSARARPSEGGTASVQASTGVWRRGSTTLGDVKSFSSASVNEASQPPSGCTREQLKGDTSACIDQWFISGPWSSTNM